MDVQCEDCGGRWNRREASSLIETLCLSCWTAKQARHAALPQTIVQERSIAHDEIFSVLGRENSELQKRVHPPDPASMLALKNLELELLMRSTLRVPPMAAEAVALVEGDRITDLPEAPRSCVRYDDDDATQPRPLDDALLAAAMRPADSSPTPPPASRSLPPPSRRPTTPPPMPEETFRPAAAPTLVVAPPSRESLPPPSTRAASADTYASRGAWVLVDSMSEDLEDIFDCVDGGPSRLIPDRPTPDSIPPASRRSRPPASSSRPSSLSDPGSLSPFAVEEGGTICAPRSRPAPVTPEPSPRNLTSGFLSAAVLVLAAVIYGGVAHDHGSSMNKSAAAPSFEVQPPVALAASMPAPASAPEPVAAAVVPSAPAVPGAESAVAPPARPVAARPRVRSVARSLPVTHSERLEQAADEALERADYTRALNIYDQIITTNPRYIPARLAVADIQWASGDHVAARSSYAHMIEEFPPSLIPDRARSRSLPTEAASAP